MDKNEENQQKQENRVNVDTTIEQLEVYIADHFATLDKLNNLLETARPSDKQWYQEQFWREGIEFRADILAALIILRNHHALDDYGLADEIRKEIGLSTFRDLEEAEKYCNKVLDLLHNYQERTESLDDEIETKKILNEVKKCL